MYNRFQHQTPTHSDTTRRPSQAQKEGLPKIAFLFQRVTFLDYVFIGKGEMATADGQKGKQSREGEVDQFMRSGQRAPARDGRRMCRAHGHGEGGSLRS